MSQSDFGTINPTAKSGSALATDLMAFRDALHSSHKGPTAPSYVVTGLVWLDDALDPLWLYKIYDGTSWITMFAVDSSTDRAWPINPGEKERFPLAGGTANALTLTPAVAMTAYADMDVLTFEAASSNSAAVTMNVSNIGAKAIRKMAAGADVALVAGDILDGVRYTANYDTAANAGAGAWVLVNEPSATLTSPGVVELATDAEAIAKADAVRALTPSNLAALGASTTLAGLVELATAAEVATGTDTARAPSVSTMGSHQGMAKAWVNFNGDGTVAIRDSFNVTSITDNGVGDYTINFTTAFANANYVMVGSGRDDAGAGAYNLGLLQQITLTTTTANIRTRAVNNTALDCDTFHVAGFGD
ncbi:hypothetical protein EDC40_10353 [Aminobacter aminovorans]|uniref:Tail fiber protein n=1 Tax=Aminobacter aminovorans TaxID=83263 RepID=A0A380WLS5_AMIAI|nr:hypothetical protein [Aminobacter aminovorans]TCS27588.1 hypothetical protein EDC40_10353 [Aminobacter aminovorans]SUU89999.1 Uncharacterised protein [Aminobacter aminovorans]